MVLALVGIALPILQVFSITMTANHFLLDAAAGGVVALAGIGVAVALQRWGYPAGARLVRRLAGAGSGEAGLAGGGSAGAGGSGAVAIGLWPGCGHHMHRNPMSSCPPARPA